MDEPMRELRLVLRLAFPYDQRTPSESLKIGQLPIVAGDILNELLLPESSSGLRCGRPTASAMSMPEATVYENHLLASRKTDIGGSGKITPVQTITITETVQEPPNE